MTDQYAWWRVSTGNAVAGADAGNSGVMRIALVVLLVPKVVLAVPMHSYRT